MGQLIPMPPPEEAPPRLCEKCQDATRAANGLAMLVALAVGLAVGFIIGLAL